MNEYDWDRIDFLLVKVKEVHPKASEGIAAFIVFLEQAQKA